LATKPNERSAVKAGSGQDIRWIWHVFAAAERKFLAKYFGEELSHLRLAPENACGVAIGSSPAWFKSG
jgi:hypothetical protein